MSWVKRRDAVQRLYGELSDVRVTLGHMHKSSLDSYTTRMKVLRAITDQDSLACALGCGHRDGTIQSSLRLSIDSRLQDYTKLLKRALNPVDLPFITIPIMEK